MTETTPTVWYHHKLGKYKVEKSRWGTFRSFLEDGTEMVTGATEEAVRISTEFIHMPFYFGDPDTSDIKVSKHDVGVAVDL